VAGVGTSRELVGLDPRASVDGGCQPGGLNGRRPDLRGLGEGHHRGPRIGGVCGLVVAAVTWLVMMVVLVVTDVEVVVDEPEVHFDVEVEVVEPAQWDVGCDQERNGCYRGHARRDASRSSAAVPRSMHGTPF
jgi:hypothetical protein